MAVDTVYEKREQKMIRNEVIKVSLGVIALLIFAMGSLTAQPSSREAELELLVKTLQERIKKIEGHPDHIEEVSRLLSNSFTIGKPACRLLKRLRINGFCRLARTAEIRSRHCQAA